MSGKGDDRRPGAPGAYERGFDAIDWSAREREAMDAAADALRFGLSVVRIEADAKGCAVKRVPPGDWRQQA